jgi:hypothetical protein
MARVPAGSQGNVPPLTASTAPSAIRSSKRSKARSFHAATDERTTSLFLSGSGVTGSGMRRAGGKLGNFSAAWSILRAWRSGERRRAGDARPGSARPTRRPGCWSGYRPSLYAAAVRLPRDRDEAHDAVQEAYLIALARLGGRPMSRSQDWSAHEREAIDLGVRATIVGLVAGPDHTILEIDFTNPASAHDHCPHRSTFVHRLVAGRSRRRDIHYV